MTSISCDCRETGQIQTPEDGEFIHRRTTTFVNFCADLEIVKQTQGTALATTRLQSVFVRHVSPPARVAPAPPVAQLHGVFLDKTVKKAEQEKTRKNCKRRTIDSKRQRHKKDAQYMAAEGNAEKVKRPKSRSRQCKSQVYPELVEEAQSGGTILLLLPPHTSHVLQPLDVSFFGTLKADFSDFTEDQSADSTSFSVFRKEFSRVLRDSYQGLKDRQVVLDGFRRCVLCPLNPGAIISSQVLFMCDGARHPCTCSINSIGIFCAV
ncbi:hypothetical protein EXN66_Car006269 [Channa argus]|uniref:DDE-1 domain-containing protein n=1 Tax=Channa argus TaxID=215402 RepID=A0A6G1PKR1_CHAAH|nr:hypothetical protein EXN66_Car006269 [Channa argus]